ncbi:putative inorganic phosphate cotransporter isoform X2 [Adelges cooleyi]|uniref:putative inorganic phosphate cotransporter isoform X2 n=1 Tax=Adelges cooleyi TaxID=133065 RepID=UPI00217F9E67|nr:putative inorganic phosphate cotransporter isoform X2 [Adelges cooleyi]
MDDQGQQPENTKRWGVRHTQIILMFLCMMIAYALRMNLAVAIVAMTDKSGTNKDFTTFDWDKRTQAMVLTSFFWGYLITQVFAGQMSEKYGPKLFLAGAIGVNGILALGTPAAAIHGGVVAMCANRMIQGMAQGFIYPSINVLLSKWAPLTEKSRIFSFVFSGIIFGPLIMLPVAGLLAGSPGGWPSIFYFTGIVSMLWVLVWYFYGVNSPSEHKTISAEEKRYITSSLSNSMSKKKLPTPWGKIVTSVPMWAILVAHFSQNWGFWTLLNNTPTYINEILKFNIKSNGILSALPYLTMWLMTIAISWISDYINKRQYMTITAQRKMWNTVAHWGGALALFSLYMFDTSTVEVLFLLTAALTLNSGVYSGFLANHLDLAPNFAGTLMGITNSLANVTSIMGPLLVGFMVDKDNPTKEQWGLVFLLSGGVFFVGNLFYIIFGSAETQQWNNSITDQPKELTKEDSPKS